MTPVHQQPLVVQWLSLLRSKPISCYTTVNHPQVPSLPATWCKNMLQNPCPFDHIEVVIIEFDMLKFKPLIFRTLHAEYQLLIDSIRIDANKICPPFSRRSDSCLLWYGSSRFVKGVGVLVLQVTSAAVCLPRKHEWESWAHANKFHVRVCMWLLAVLSRTH